MTMCSHRVWTCNFCATQEVTPLDGTPDRWGQFLLTDIKSGNEATEPMHICSDCRTGAVNTAHNTVREDHDDLVRDQIAQAEHAKVGRNPFTSIELDRV